MSRLFDGVDDSLSIDSAPATAAPLTMACWFFPTPTSLQLGNLIWLGDKDVTNHVLELQMQAAGTLRLRAAAGGTFVNALTTTSATLDTWHHACGVCASATDRSVYLNGGGVGTNATNRAPAGIDRISIGRHMASTPIEPFKGRIAEVAVWNVALSAAEVAALARGVHPLMIRPAAIVFYAPLWGTSSPENDLTRGRRHLTVTGATVGRHAPVAPLFGDLWVPMGFPAGGTTFTISPGGTITPVGALANLTAKPFAGAITPGGTLARLTAKLFGGTVTPTGTLAKTTSKPFAGSVTPAGTLGVLKVIIMVFTGGITPSGALTRITGKGLGGTIQPAGTISKALTKLLSGQITPNGVLLKLIAKPLSGAIAPAGSLATQIIQVAASVAFIGRVALSDVATFFTSISDRFTYGRSLSDESRFGVDVSDHPEE